MDIERLVSAYKNPKQLFVLDGDEKMRLAEVYEILENISSSLSFGHYILWNRTENWILEIFNALGFFAEYFLENGTVIGIKISYVP
jgi:hypothetical protein